MRVSIAIDFDARTFNKGTLSMSASSPDSSIYRLSAMNRSTTRSQSSVHPCCTCIGKMFMTVAQMMESCHGLTAVF